jgi:hypothetical protein
MISDATQNSYISSNARSLEVDHTPTLRSPRTMAHVRDERQFSSGEVDLYIETRNSGGIGRPDAELDV